MLIDMADRRRFLLDTHTFSGVALELSESWTDSPQRN